MRPVMTDPEQCRTMTDVRSGIDALDRDIVALLARRFAYMRAAARIKPDRGMVRDEARKAEVIEQVRQEASRLDLPADALAELWDRLVEISIGYELTAFDANAGGDSPGC